MEVVDDENATLIAQKYKPVLGEEVNPEFNSICASEHVSEDVSCDVNASSNFSKTCDCVVPSKDVNNEVTSTIGCESTVLNHKFKDGSAPSEPTTSQAVETNNAALQGKSYTPIEPNCVVVSHDTVNNSSQPTAEIEKEMDIPLGESQNGKINYGTAENQSCSSSEELPNLRRHIGIRSLIAFWLLGLCNNYGYVVMLSAAHDILAHKYDSTETGNYTGSSNETLSSTVAPTVDPNHRYCNNLTTGAILLADIIPSLMIKITAPFFPLCIHFRMMLVVILSISGYVLVAASVAPWMAICGVVSTALASGIGEASFLSYMAFYKDKDVISTWSSGTGGAGFFGSLTYAFLLSIGLTPATTLYSLTSIPLLMSVTFWVILRHPRLNEHTSSPPVCGSIADDDNCPTSYDRYQSEDVPLETTKDTFLEKLEYIPKLFKFMIPIGLVYLFEYFINQGLFELVYFPGIWLTLSEQYRWYQVLYQIGVFISRSSLRLIHIKQLWILAVLQFLNVILFLVQSIYSVIPSIYIIMALVLWEGLLGGAAYVNTFHKITVEVPPNKREFSMAITSFADALGITIAGISAFPTHNYICQLPLHR